MLPIPPLQYPALAFNLETIRAPADLTMIGICRKEVEQVFVAKGMLVQHVTEHTGLQQQVAHPHRIALIGSHSELDQPSDRFAADDAFGISARRKSIAPVSGVELTSRQRAQRRQFVGR